MPIGTSDGQQHESEFDLVLAQNNIAQPKEEENIPITPEKQHGNITFKFLNAPDKEGVSQGTVNADHHVPLAASAQLDKDMNPTGSVYIDHRAPRNAQFEDVLTKMHEVPEAQYMKHMVDYGMDPAEAYKVAHDATTAVESAVTNHLGIKDQYDQHWRDVASISKEATDKQRADDAHTTAHNLDFAFLKPENIPDDWKKATKEQWLKRFEHQYEGNQQILPDPKRPDPANPPPQDTLIAPKSGMGQVGEGYLKSAREALLPPNINKMTDQEQKDFFVNSLVGNVGGGPEMAVFGAAAIGRKALLRTAEHMESLGSPEGLIHKLTGLFKGEEGIWRYEVPDNMSNLKWDFINKHKNDTAGMNLQNVIHHPELFKEFPELKDIMVNHKESLGDNAFIRHGNEDGSQPTRITLNFGSNVARENLFHEIQHEVQKLHGLAEGTSPEFEKRRSENLFSAIFGNKNNMISGIGETPFEKYKNAPGERESRVVGQRAAGQGYGTTPMEHMRDEPIYEDPIQKHIREIDRLKKAESLRARENLLKAINQAREDRGQPPLDMLPEDTYNGPASLSMEPTEREWGTQEFDINNDEGKRVGFARIDDTNPKHLFVQYVGREGLHRAGIDKNTLGPSEIRSLLPAIKKQYPNAESLSGHRVSGARAHDVEGYGKTRPAKPSYLFDEKEKPDWLETYDKEDITTIKLK